MRYEALWNTIKGAGSFPDFEASIRDTYLCALFNSSCTLQSDIHFYANWLSSYINKVLEYATLVVCNGLDVRRMAASAILQRKKFLFDSLHQPKWLVRWFSSLEHGSSSGVPYSRNWSWAVSYSSSSTNHVNEEDSHSLSNDEALTTLTKEFLRCNSSCIPTLGYGIGRSGVLSPLGARWTIEYARYFSTAAAGQSELGSSEIKNEEQAMKQKKEASPEECDQAVEGLSTVKAKAKAAKIPEGC
ncbi:unnamed protein product [Fraxinus pennsylvanica]|uniref:Uncharacterized protein n=1 Tax=Fraxinus pennsylvanica TaxID=56036 RepID=A0AAD1ZDS5_9LAMI|nr:unnamed protein product [Fraxinus pennsylvanica]